MKYFKKLKGENLYLSPMSVDDATIFTKWINDKNVSENLGLHVSMISLTTEKAKLEKMCNEGYCFSIVLNDGDKLIGSISFNQMDNLNQNATIGILIGEESSRNKGYGTEAIKLLIDYGFNSLNLINIMLTVNATNIPAIKCYEKVGFKEFGRRSKCTFLNGEFIDIVYMEILRK